MPLEEAGDDAIADAAAFPQVLHLNYEKLVNDLETISSLENLP